MLTLSFFIFCAVAFFLIGCLRSNSRNSSMRMINADWLEQEEKFKLISRWGVKW
ncbi:hypothetical protein SAMN02745165_01776 [Malonomonas rubra DSM 5091]|uniref:Uncharacterized protein n=1 Tax=Malonomonas rubra DSM 5091 TaxID=1122189 RepID=A0A1M6HBX9_MALRU|nr:hypothetical protein [Malonomonas rubra]SHJ19691.1 hypothetical protein SAMN02745165_01776 [Malonomonas rubra DSM 5091]